MPFVVMTSVPTHTDDVPFRDCPVRVCSENPEIINAGEWVVAVPNGDDKVYTFVNLTPHPVTVGGVTFPPSGSVARCELSSRDSGQMMTQDGPVSIKTLEMGELTGLPEPKPLTSYIVSLAAAQSAWRMGREDVYTIGPTIKDESGKIIGSEYLSAIPDEYES